MKLLIALLFTTLATAAQAQTHGVPEIDSLIKVKDKLLASIMLETDKREEANMIFAYSWTVYQLDKWLEGEEKKMCIYRDYGTGGEFIASCPEPYEYITNEHRDTMVYMPKEITFDGFIRYYTNRLVKESIFKR